MLSERKNNFQNCASRNPKKKGKIEIQICTERAKKEKPQNVRHYRDYDSP